MLKRLSPGGSFADIKLTTISGEELAIPRADGWTHLQFRRYAGCPICNLHLRTMATRFAEIAAANIRVVPVFHSDRKTMLPFLGDLPFQAVADPEKRLYRQYGVESSWRSVLHPKVVADFVRSTVAPHRNGWFVGDEAGHLGLPADFLISPSGLLVAVKYGLHASDHWSVDELLSLARAMPWESLR
jgi:peroxiredoxin